MKALDGCIGILAAQGEVSGITEDYRQDADFYWLTGINEPGAYLVLAPKARFNKVTLFLKAAIRKPSAGPGRASRSRRISRNATASTRCAAVRRKRRWKASASIMIAWP